MKKKLTEPLEPKFFVLTEPDERVQEYVFNNKMQLASENAAVTLQDSPR